METGMRLELFRREDAAEMAGKRVEAACRHTSARACREHSRMITDVLWR